MEHTEAKDLGARPGSVTQTEPTDWSLYVQLILPPNEVRERCQC
jgi:hypothetical protein